MKSTKKILATTAFIIVCGNLYSQSFLFDQAEFFNTILDAKFKINSYYIGGNPANLDKEISDERLLIEAAFDNRHGDFKGFVMPKDQSALQISFTGKKKISETGIFKGSAGFNREVRNNWNWVANKNYQRAKTFIYGDSTTGTSRYHSILLNAQYRDEISKNLNIGFSIDYAVDEGLKKVSPKPESEHRDIYLNIGLSYKLDKDNLVGAAFKYQDFTEEIDYREDEGAIYDETRILKFTGYDYPSVYYKKVEERRSNTNGYFAVLNFEHKSNDLKAVAAFTAGFDKQNIKDGGTDPILKGFSKNTLFTGDVVLLYRIDENLLASAGYQYRYSDYWAKHPDFNVLLMEEEIPSHFFNLGMEYKIDENLVLGCEGSIRLHEYSMNDYYSDIAARFDAVEYGGTLGLSYYWNEMITTTTGIAYINNKLSDEGIEQDETGNYYENYRKYDLLYKLTSTSSINGYLKTMFNFSRFGEICLNLQFAYLRPEDQSVFEGLNQNNINVWLQFRKEVY